MFGLPETVEKREGYTGMKMVHPHDEEGGL